LNNETFQNQTFQNQSFTNNTNLNQTINEGDLVNNSGEQQVETTPEGDTSSGLSWLPLVVVVLMVLLLCIQALHLVKKPALPPGPPESMLVEQELFDEVDHTDVVIDAKDDFNTVVEDDPILSPERKDLDHPQEEGPPLIVEKPIISDGFEWVEWPEGSGQNHFREVGSTDEWKAWPVE
jgi:hypothetical protein